MGKYTQARLNFSVPPPSYLSHWRKHSLMPVFLRTFISLLLSCLFVSDFIYIVLSMLHTVAKWFHFPDLRSQRESIVYLNPSSHNAHTQLKVLNLIKRTEWLRYAWNAVVYLPWDICGSTVRALLIVLGAEVINIPFSLVSIFLNVTI